MIDFRILRNTHAKRSSICSCQQLCLVSSVRQPPTCLFAWHRCQIDIRWYYSQALTSTSTNADVDTPCCTSISILSIIMLILLFSLSIVLRTNLAVPVELFNCSKYTYKFHLPTLPSWCFNDLVSWSGNLNITAVHIPNCPSEPCLMHIQVPLNVEIDFESGNWCLSSELVVQTFVLQILHSILYKHSRHWVTSVTTFLFS